MCFPPAMLASQDFLLLTVTQLHFDVPHTWDRRVSQISEGVKECYSPRKKHSNPLTPRSCFAALSLAGGRCS